MYGTEHVLSTNKPSIKYPESHSFFTKDRSVGDTLAHGLSLLDGSWTCPHLPTKEYWEGFDKIKFSSPPPESNHGTLNVKSTLLNSNNHLTFPVTLERSPNRNYEFRRVNIPI